MKITFDTENNSVTTKGCDLDKDFIRIGRMMQHWENGEKDESIYGDELMTKYATGFIDELSLYRFDLNGFNEEKSGLVYELTEKVVERVKSSGTISPKDFYGFGLLMYYIGYHSEPEKKDVGEFGQKLVNMLDNSFFEEEIESVEDEEILVPWWALPPLDEDDQ